MVPWFTRKLYTVPQNAAKIARPASWETMPIRVLITGPLLNWADGGDRSGVDRHKAGSEP